MVLLVELAPLGVSGAAGLLVVAHSALQQPPLAHLICLQDLQPYASLSDTSEQTKSRLKKKKRRGGRGRRVGGQGTIAAADHGT